MVSTVPAAALGLAVLRILGAIEWKLDHYFLFCSKHECWVSITAQTCSKYEVVIQYVIQIKMIVLLYSMNHHDSQATNFAVHSACSHKCYARSNKAIAE
jgi:hypothetical protein